MEACIFDELEDGNVRIGLECVAGIEAVGIRECEHLSGALLDGGTGVDVAGSAECGGCFFGLCLSKKVE